MADPRTPAEAEPEETLAEGAAETLYPDQVEDDNWLKEDEAIRAEREEAGEPPLEDVEPAPDEQQQTQPTQQQQEFTPEEIAQHHAATKFAHDLDAYDGIRKQSEVDGDFALQAASFLETEAPKLRQRYDELHVSATMQKLGRTQEQLFKDIPALANDQTRAELREYLMGQGFSREEVGSIRDPKVVRVAFNSMKRDQMLKGRKPHTARLKNGAGKSGGRRRATPSLRNDASIFSKLSAIEILYPRKGR